jgi:cell division protein FtsL
MEALATGRSRFPTKKSRIIDKRIAFTTNDSAFSPPKIHDIEYKTLQTIFSAQPDHCHINTHQNNYLKIMGVFSSQRPHISIASTPIN